MPVKPDDLGECHCRSPYWKGFQNPIVSACGGIAALPREAGFATILLH
jgi:hypothetical protein